MKVLRALFVVLLLLPVAAAPAHADGRLTATIMRMDPALPAADSTITLEVKVGNHTGADLRNLSATFLIGTEPLMGRSQIPDVLDGRTLPTYRLLDAPAAQGIDLPDGSVTSLTLTTRAAALRLSSARPGAYLFGVRLSGTGVGKDVTVNAVTLLPWMPRASDGSLDVLTVWTLTAPPTRGADGAFTSDTLIASLASGGRLRMQLDQMAKVPGALWLLDPLLVESVQALAAGADVRVGATDLRRTTEAEQASAQQWLDDLRVGIATGTWAAIPLGDFDVRAALKFRRITLIRHAAGTAPERLAAALGVAEPPLAIPLYGGAITKSSWRFLTEIGASIAVVSDVGYPATQSRFTPTTGLAMSEFRGRIVVASQDIASAPLDTNGARARQRLAAQLLMASLERPNSGRAVTIAIGPEWNPHADADIAPVLDAPWLEHIAPAQALDAGTDERGYVQIPATTKQRQQDRRTDGAVASQRLLARLTDDAGFGNTVGDTVSGILSRWWTGRLSRDTFGPLVREQLADLASSVRVVTRGDIVFGGENGSVPVTIANGLPVAVDVTLQTTGVPSVRVQAREITPVHLNAGKRVSVEIPTRVSGSGDGYLLLQLVTGENQFINQPSLLTVRSAAYARVASYLVAVAFAALMLLIAVNTMRRIRMRREGIVEDE